MSRRAKVKIIRKQMANDGELSDMFNQMMGTGQINLEIAYPRYLRLRELLAKLRDLYTSAAGTIRLLQRANTYYATPKRHILAFCANITGVLAESSIPACIDVDKYMLDGFKGIPAAEVEQFAKLYELVKNSQVCKMCIMTYDELSHYKDKVNYTGVPDHRFVFNIIGCDWRPLKFTRLDIVGLLMDDSSADNARTVMELLRATYELTASLFNELQSPDVDVDKFVEVIAASLEQIKKIPELHRCTQAFRKIEESLDLLKSKFNTYYHDFVVTKDSTIIMQHFILDVSKSSDDVPAKVTAQFGQIIAYYRKSTRGKIQDPMMAKLLDRLTESLGHLNGANEPGDAINDVANDIDDGDSDSQNEDDDGEPEADAPTKSASRPATTGADSRENSAARAQHLADAPSITVGAGPISGQELYNALLAKPAADK